MVKELQPEDGYEEVQKIAASMLDMLSSEVMLSTRVAYGTIVNEIKEVSRPIRKQRWPWKSARFSLWTERL